MIIRPEPGPNDKLWWNVKCYDEDSCEYYYVEKWATTDGEAEEMAEEEGHEVVYAYPLDF